VKPFAILNLVALFVTASLGQSETHWSCPKIEVVGPAGIFDPFQLWEIRARISGAVPHGLTYFWSVTQGKIVEGQGTSSIRVKQDLNGGVVNEAVTLEIEGLPYGCSRTFTTTIGVAVESFPVLLSEFSARSFSQFQRELRKGIEVIQHDKDDTLYIIEYFKKGTSATQKRRKLERISRFLTDRLGLDKARFAIVSDEAAADRVKIYRLPSRAEKFAP
jgi:hypothetical protein